MNTFTLFWLTGHRNVVTGLTIADACNNAGFGAGAIPALDFFAEGDCDDYVWDEVERTWVKKSG